MVCRQMGIVKCDICLLYQQQNTETDQRGGDPTAVVNVLMQDELCQHGGADNGERG